MPVITVAISPHDTWFLRGARGHHDPGGGAAESMFPPPARAVAGAVRSLLGNLTGRDWQAGAVRSGRARSADDALFETLSLRGPYLAMDGKRHYPLPRTHLKTADGGAVRLTPAAAPSRCDLGMVRLPMVADATQAANGLAPAEDLLVDGSALRGLLDDTGPVRSLPGRPLKHLMEREPRLGIERDDHRKSSAEGMLYQPVHLRHTGVPFAVEVDLELRASHKQPSADRGQAQFMLDRASARLEHQVIARFGAEHRVGAYAVTPPSAAVPPPVRAVGERVLIMFTTHADFGGDWKPAHFRADSAQGADAWSGWINLRVPGATGALETRAVHLSIISAVIGKAVRESGWDVAENRPRPAVSLVPAGSAWFCLTSTPQTAALLHGAQLGNAIPLGRGEIAVGTW
ncbi:MAG: type III-B CRISPR module-associated Cmr3 family protein [Burkholderiales bacterium]